MMELWEKSIKPTLVDYNGEALVCSNSAGKNPNNFFYNICTDPHYAFKELKPPRWIIPYFRIMGLSRIAIFVAFAVEAFLMTRN
jgi:hypothetical protein